MMLVDFDEINLQTTDVELRTASVEVKQKFQRKISRKSFKMLSHIIRNLYEANFV
jgi:hypothetical protein